MHFVVNNNYMGSTSINFRTNMQLLNFSILCVKTNSVYCNQTIKLSTSEYCNSFRKQSVNLKFRHSDNAMGGRRMYSNQLCISWQEYRLQSAYFTYNNERYIFLLEKFDFINKILSNQKLKVYILKCDFRFLLPILVIMEFLKYT